MARIKKESRIFGLAPGKHRAKRQRIRVGSGNVKHVFKCTLKEGAGVTIIKKRRAIANNRMIMKLLKPTIKKKFQVYRSVDGVLRSVEINNIAATGYRIINLQCLQKHVSEITCHAILCNKAREKAISGAVPIILESQVAHFGLAVILAAKCTGCGKKFHFETSPKLLNVGTRHYDINVRAVWGSIVSGNGLAHLNEQLASMDSPTMAQNTFSVIEKEINQWWKVMVEEEMSSAIDLEKKIAIEKNRYHEDIPSITVICDGGWSKRSHKHSYNALGGVAVVIGAETKKILHIGIRNKYCYICNRCNSLGITPKDHECFKNWTESSQSMESDIIVEGFLKANDFGVRYMHFIADGDSSIHAQIMERVPVWGKFVQKMECANHITKCLRGNLENLVNENPSYKGKGKLCKRTRIRIVSAVRCSIRRRSSEKNKTLAIKNLEHDIRNTTSHIYGDHTRCNEDFCKVKQTSDKNHSNGAQTDAVDDDNDDDNGDDNGDDDIFLQQSEMWTQGTSLQAQEQSRGSYMLSNSDLQSGMRQDLALLLNNVARKARSLLGNFTTNLAECWMHMRTKFDGGKILNHCNRGSWHTRCYATALRFNKGPTWSPNVWEQATESTPGAYFEKLYEQRKQCINNNNTTKDKCTIKQNRWKRKMSSIKESNTKKAKQHYGKESLQVETDIASEELEKLKVNYLNKNIDIPETEIIKIEKNTTSQICSEIWKDERKKRITASNFGSVVKRNSKIKIAPLIKQLLYSTFKGNKTTRIGLKEEKVTITEYVNIKQKQNIHTKVEQSGLVIDKHHKFLGGSPDGVVTENNAKGLIEIKNLVHDKNINLTQASMSVKNFCLENISNNLKLKTNHNYYFQCQGLLNVCNLPWIDFVVRTLNPYDIHIERIYKDTVLRQTKMIPKLTAFYHNALLPELVSPRYNKYPGIREPGIWYTEVPYLGSASSQQTSGKVKTRQRKSLTVESDTEIDEPVVTTTSKIAKRSKRKCSGPKFVGREILHEWVEENSNRKWYKGRVISVIQNKDGDKDAVYEVLYEDCDEPYEIDHLLEDFTNSSLKLIDL